MTEIEKEVIRYLQPDYVKAIICTPLPISDNFDAPMTVDMSIMTLVIAINKRGNEVTPHFIKKFIGLDFEDIEPGPRLDPLLRSF